MGDSGGLSLERIKEKLRECESSLTLIQEKYKSFLEQSHEAIYCTEFDRPIDTSLPVEEQIDAIYANAYLGECNPAMAKLYGFSSPDEFMGKRLVDFHGGSDNPVNRETFKKFIEAGYRNIDNETVEKTPDGRELYFVSNDIGIVKDGMLIRIWGTATEITERKEKEALKRAMMEQERFSEIGKMSGNLAHDFNNILGIVLGHADTSVSPASLDEALKRLSVIQEAASRGKQIVKDLLQFAKDREPFKTTFDPCKRIDGLLDELNFGGKSYQIKTKYAKDAKKLSADIGLFDNAIINMLQNSIHAMSRTAHPKLRVEVVKKDDRLVITLEDNGCGIPAEARKHIYKPNFTLKGKEDIYNSYSDNIMGNGFGMANVLRFVEKHGGSIDFESVFGHGTKFTIALPSQIAQETDDERAAILGQSLNCRGGGLALIVEDEEYVREVFKEMLEEIGVAVDTADNGAATIEMMSRKKYDVVSLDYWLPDDNGMDVYKKIRSIDKSIPVIFVSGSDEFLNYVKSFKDSDAALDYLPKPFDNSEYVGKICAAIASSRRPG